MLQLLGDSVPRPPAGVLPLDPTGGLCPPDPLTHFAVPSLQYFPQVYAYEYVHHCVFYAIILLEVDLRPYLLYKKI